MIISQTKPATGRFTCATVAAPRARNGAGSIWPSATPATLRALLQPAQAVIDENISPRNLRLEFDHRRPPQPGPGWTARC
jgi:hypothetical protein